MRDEIIMVINRPIEEVWAFLADPFNIPRLRGLTLGTRLTSPGPIGVGTTFEQRVVILGFEARVSGVFTEWDPPHTLAFSGSGAGIQSSSVRQTLEATSEGTKFVRAVEIEPRPALKPLFWLLAPLIRPRVDAAMQNLKRLLEADRG